MNLKHLFKKSTKPPIATPSQSSLISETPDNIEIIIENQSPYFKNEEGKIRKNAKILFEGGDVDSYEEGVIVFATMIRGLEYVRTDIGEDGKKTIIFKERT